MALSITIEIGSTQATESLDLTELEALRVTADPDYALSRAMDLLFAASASSKPSTVYSGDLINALDVVLEASAKLNATIYYIFSTPMPGQWPKGSSSEITGVRIGDEILHIMGGVNECTIDFGL